MSVVSASMPAGVREAWIVRTGAPCPLVWGLTPEQRLRRALGRAGCRRVAVLEPERTALERSAPVAVFRDDLVLDERLVTALLRGDDELLLVAPDGGPLAARVRGDLGSSALAALAGRPCAVQAAAPLGARRVTPAELVPGYDARLRKADPPIALRARPGQVRELERRVFDASYKGVTDLVTKWVWPRPAEAATRWCTRVGIGPNAITLASWLLAAVAAVLFARGAFGTGLLAAWLMTFLDTVDGKLARVTLRASPIGHALDHGLDLIHPPFWYLAWSVGLSGDHPFVTAAVVGGYLAGRGLEGIFLLAFGIEIHTWRSVDALFRTITARRNPNLILLSVGTLGGRPDLGLAMVAIWTGASLGFHGLRLHQAFRARGRGEPIGAATGGAALPPSPREPAAEAVLEMPREGIGVGARRMPVQIPKPIRGLALLLATAMPAALLAPADAAAEAPSRAAAPGGESAPHARVDPGPVLSEADTANEYWDLVGRFETGHRVFARFLLTNEGPGTGTAAAVGHLVGPDGVVVTFKNAKMKGGWTLTDGGRRLRIGSSILHLGSRHFEHDNNKRGIKVHLDFPADETAVALATRGPDGFGLDLLNLSTPARGWLWLEGMEERVPLNGRVALTHSWHDAREQDVALRRIDFASLDAGPSVYLAELMSPEGKTWRWLAVARDGRIVEHLDAFELGLDGRSEGSTAAYPVPRALRIESRAFGGRVEVGSPLVAHDPTDVIPFPFRMFYFRGARPQRVWAESTLSATLAAPSAEKPPVLRELGVTTLTYLNPLH